MEKWGVPLAFLAGIVITSTAIPIIKRVDEFNHCVYEIVREFPSPNKRLTAIVILSGCMLAPEVSSVAIKLDGENFRFNKDNYLFDVKGENDIEVLWDSNDALTIIHAHPDLIYRKVVVWRTMEISYREKP